jgi:hypothetical protein
MGQARVFIPILALARIRPMLRTSVPPPTPPPFPRKVVCLHSEDRLEPRARTAELFILFDLLLVVLRAPRAHGGFRPIAGLALAVDAALQPSGAQVASVASDRQAGSARTPAPV